MSSKVRKLLEKYSKYCPKCKTYQDGVWEECHNCRTTLIDAKKAYKTHRVRKMIANVLLILLLILMTYGIQPSERQYYNKSIGLLFAGKFHDSKEALQEAFSNNPICKSARLCLEGIKYKLTHRTVVIEIR